MPGKMPGPSVLSPRNNPKKVSIMLLAELSATTSVWNDQFPTELPGVSV
jgi:hypothetical protein